VLKAAVLAAEAKTKSVSEKGLVLLRRLAIYKALQVRP
jgi:hypothetical protein